MNGAKSVAEYADPAMLPRVLIVGQTFTTDTGGGITLSNLFKNWPIDKLAVAVESKEGINFSKAASYYRIGYQELQMPFPFSVFQRKTKSGEITAAGAVGAVKVKETSNIKFKLKNYFDDILHYSGLFFWMYGNQTVSEPLINWIRNFGPDIIYYQPNSFKSIDFLLSVKANIDVPLVTHVMDDWFSFAVRPGPFKVFWQKKLDKKVNMLFAKTDLHMSICNYMSEEYDRRYGYNFVPFHNSVDLNFWSPGIFSPWKAKNPVNILYAGRVGYGLEKILLKICNVIEKMGKKGIPVCLEIQTKDQRHPVLKKIGSYKHLEITGPVEYEDLPRKFSEADILLIPSDFDGPGAKFIKYSMPTKVSEYMSTGKPILVIGPPDTALTSYAEDGWALVCRSDEAQDIESSILNLVNSEKIRSRISATAKALVMQNHEEKYVINKFRTSLMNLLTHQMHIV